MAITEPQALRLWDYLKSLTKPVSRDNLARALQFHQVKVRQAREWLLEHKSVFIVSNWKQGSEGGMFIAGKSTDFDKEINYISTSGVTLLQKALKYKKEQKRLRELEGIETPENQLPLSAEEQSLFQEAEQLVMLFGEGR